ncbi:hypothetical protein IBX38_07920 [Candidatus Bathyarchaeota archaeon]|nr:hypothetical protein [Candidatus Bathyarchaeota archaeon]
MPRHYVYRLSCDRGFAPNVEYGMCSLSGCKSNTVELWAEKGSWVIGIGGKNTGKPNKLIFAMNAEENLPYREFRRKYPEKSKYLSSKTAGTNVLVSREFYYFGNKAIEFPDHLKHIIWDRQGCKRVSDKDINKLERYLTERYDYGKIGNPNNQNGCASYTSRT